MWEGQGGQEQEVESVGSRLSRAVSFPRGWAAIQGLKARSALVPVTFQTAHSGGRIVIGVEETETNVELWGKNL